MNGESLCNYINSMKPDSKRREFLWVVLLLLSVTSCSVFENEQPLHLCEEVYIVTEQMPLLIGGMGYWQQQVQYPKEALEKGVQGRVTVQFVVSKLGETRNHEIIRGIGYGADEEALRLVKKMKFEPGRQNNERVCVQYALSINFRLEN